MSSASSSPVMPRITFCCPLMTCSTMSFAVQPGHRDSLDHASSGAASTRAPNWSASDVYLSTISCSIGTDRNNGKTCVSRRLWGAADEGQQFGLDVGVIGDVDARPVLAALAQHFVHRQHAFEHHGALVRVQGLVLAGGAREVPAVQEHVAGVDHVD